jgi:hypothetical protein
MLETDGPNHHGMHVLLILVSTKELPEYGDRQSAQIGFVPSNARDYSRSASFS